MKAFSFAPYLMLLFFSFSFIACSDDDDDGNPGPDITLTGIADGDEFSISQDGMIVLAGVMEDEDGISKLIIDITGPSGAFPPLEEDQFQDNGNNQYPFGATIDISLAPTGKYDIQLRALDGLGNESRENLSITIVE